MIQATELRIGNLIEKSLKSGQGRKIIDKVGVQDIVRIFENTGPFNYEPIPLTEDWLVRFGFELFPWGFVKDKLLVRHSGTAKFWIEFGNGLRKELEHVHRLQNFYLETFDKELELK